MSWIKRLFYAIAEFFRKSQAEEVVTEEPTTEEPDRPGTGEAGAKLLWYPLATIIKGQRSSGTYRRSYPEGAIVHFTAGRDQTEQEAIDSLNWGAEQGFAFFVIGPTGKVYQSIPLDKWGSHAGTSAWEGLGSSVSSKLVGIEVACAGQLEGDKAWFGKTYPSTLIRTVDSSHECQPGNYKKFTREQEVALRDLLLWLKRNNPEVFSLDYVLGHHEVSGVKGIGYWRKPDPGGSLSVPMSQFRTILKKEYNNEQTRIS